MSEKYCRTDSNGGGTIFVCPRDGYCCNDGCCISPTFQFYPLFNYWAMVLFMFLICSGGQWMYRWMHRRCASAMPPPPTRASYPRQCRVAYTPARDAVVLHHLWKPSSYDINGPPPLYSAMSTSSGSGTLKPSLYMQLYGPPPSYDESWVSSGAAGGCVSGVESPQQAPLPPAPPPEAPQYLPLQHQRTGSLGNPSHHQQYLTLSGGCSSQGPYTHVRRCSAPLHHHYTHHHQPSQKVSVEPVHGREGCSSLPSSVLPQTSSTLAPPSCETSTTSRPPPEDLPYAGTSRSHQQEQIAVVVQPPLPDQSQPPPPQLS